MCILPFPNESNFFVQNTFLLNLYIMLNVLDVHMKEQSLARSQLFMQGLIIPWETGEVYLPYFFKFLQMEESRVLKFVALQTAFAKSECTPNPIFVTCILNFISLITTCQAALPLWAQIIQLASTPYSLRAHAN